MATLQEMLETERLDVVDICSPPRTHADIAIRSLQAGAHAMIEKPMAIGIEECDQIIAASQAKRSQNLRRTFRPVLSVIPESPRTREQGAIGEFRGMRIFLSTPLDYITSKPDHWAHRLPGGVIGETGPHVIYMTLAFINPIHAVRIDARKQLPQFPWSPYEDYRLDLIGESASAALPLRTRRTDGLCSSISGAATAT